MQINLQNSRAATDNLIKLIEQDNTDIIFIQEPYLYQDSMAGISMSHRNYSSHEEKSRAAIIITNKKNRRRTYQTVNQSRQCTPRTETQ
jgi:exonuclease III